jgi:hypothetical protein
MDGLYAVDLRLRLEGHDPVFGSVQDQRGETYRFFGWVELAELVQRLANALPDEAGKVRRLP